MATPPAPPPAQWLARGSFVDLLGRRIFYRREGAGVPLVCVHGYPTASWDWHAIWPELAARFDVISMDMLGFGFSDKPRGHRYRVVEQADLHEALLARLGIDTFHLLCHDYGVSVGQELLARYEEGRLPGLRSIAFLNGGLFPETHRPRPVQRLLASPLGPWLTRFLGEASFARSMRAVFGPTTQPSDAELRALFSLVEHGDGRHALAGLIAYMAERRAQRERWVGALVSTRLPMRVINGSHDPVSGAHLVTRLLELRPGADVVRLPVGHYPQLESPEGVLAAYLPFVSALDQGVREA